MKRTILGIAAVLALLSWVTPGFAKPINGTLEKIDGSYYVVMDDEGNEHRIHFDETTRKTGEPDAGMLVEIDENNGHAKSIKVVEADISETEGMDHNMDKQYQEGDPE
jgi:hypothetical protein